MNGLALRADGDHAHAHHVCERAGDRGHGREDAHYARDRVLLDVNELIRTYASVRAHWRASGHVRRQVRVSAFGY